MSIHSTIAKFLHRGRNDAAATEAGLKKVVEAIVPHVSKVKTSIVEELRDDIAHVGTTTQDAMAILDSEHKNDIAALAAGTEDHFKEVFTRLDGLVTKLDALKADTAAKTASARKTAAAPAVKPQTVPEAAQAAAPTDLTKASKAK
jgi:hypothetical protein